MASQQDIDLVKRNLPDWAEEVASWDDAKIAEVLDANGGQPYPAVREFWLKRVSNTSALTDILEAGSSRPLSQSHQHAIDMLQYWDKIAGAGRTTIGRIRRRYRRRGGEGLNRYGGLYVRTD